MKNVVALATLLVSFSAVSAAQADTYSNLLDKSSQAIISEKWRTGLAATRDLLALPDLTSAQKAVGLNHLCIHLSQVGRTAQAIHACNASIALDASDWGVHVNKGNALSAAGFRIAAKASYRKAEELNPTNSMIEVAESMQPQTPYAFGRPMMGAGVQQAQDKQVLAEE
jgi:tetratricopeptide (TPR) repeat protein